MRLFESFREDRALLARSGAYADALMAEPSAEDTEWLARVATRGDADHARWELRYLRRALGVLVAQRDALDDRTHAEVLRALLRRMEKDPHVDAELRELSERQFNARLSAYRDALMTRGHGTPVMRIAQNLLAFSGGPIRATDPVVQQGAELVASYRLAANDALRTAFGTAELPDDVVPSELAR
ncbi:MAG: hypothetical protein JWN79_58 [Gemmatimonadetes bacterium]|jgi:hypothetical protein|nr:hypothetical protein [Gemmatimonadota bacterium]